MVTIFHISDLHIIRSAHWNNIRKRILIEAEKLYAKNKGKNTLLIVTGDFHNFWEGDYEQAYKFLRDLIDALGIKEAEDVFLVPGNHDVGSAAAMKPFFPGDDDWAYRQETETEWLKTHDSSQRFYSKHVNGRLESYTPYCAFVRRLGVYPKDAGLTPASVHVRCWRGRLNLLHLNTTLIADGKKKTDQRLDILSATSRDVWRGQDEHLPALALGHNSYYDLDAQQQTALKPPLRDYGVCAYLCGDTHAAETDGSRQLIRLDYQYVTVADTIPNVVGIKGAADEGDTSSDFGLYLHEWDEDSGTVTLTLLRWDPKKTQGGFLRESGGTYSIPHRSPDAWQGESDRLRAEAKEKDGPQPSETSREEEARALWSAGRDEEALNLLDVSKLSKTLKDSVQQHINEHLLRIDILKSRGLTTETIPAIRASYEECVQLARAQHVSVYVLYDYADFLWKQHDYGPAIELLRWMLTEYRRTGKAEEQLARLQNLLGNLLSDINQMEEAENLYREALGIRRRLAEANPAAFEPDLATSCNNLGILLYDTKRMEEAESLYREALGIRRRLAQANPAAFKPDLADTCNSLGALLYSTKRMEEAENLYREALGICRRLATASPAAFEPDLALSCNNLGNLLYSTKRMEEAESLYREALGIYRRLAMANPAAFEPDLAYSCYNYALLLMDTDRNRDAKPLLEEAAQLWKKYPHCKTYLQYARDELARLTP